MFLSFVEMTSRLDGSAFNGRLSLRTSDNCQKGKLLQNSNFGASKLLESRLVYKEGNSFVATVDNVFTAEQCEELI